MALRWKVVICQVLFMCLVAADVQKKKRIKEYSHSVQFNEEIQSDSRLGIKSSQEDKQMKWGLDEYNEKYVDFSLRNARSISVKADDSASLSPDEVISNKYNTFNENSSVVNADGIWQTQQKPIPVMAIAEHLGKVIEQIADKDLGVTRLKAKFQARNLGNKSGDQNATQHLNLLHEALQSRVDKYARLVLRMVDAALNKSRPSPYTRTTYNPCCLLPHHILMYDEKFGCSVNSELWCDAGFGDGSDSALVGFFSPPSATLTRMFLSNAAEFPELNWQYFMSSSGLLTEYPAHRPASSSVDALHPDGASNDCQNRGRHLRVYETTVRPQPKNILLLLDVGWSTMPRSLASFVDAARLILSSLTPKDHVGVLSISDVPRSPDGRPCPDLLQPASSQRIASILRFLDKLNLDKSSPTNHTAGLARAFEAVARTAGDAPVVVAYFTSGAVDDRVTAAATHRALAPIAGPLYPRLRLAVLAADLRHLRSREYRGRQQLLRCLVAIADTGRPQRPPAPSAAECPLSLHHPRTPLGKTGVESHSLLLSLNTSVVSPAVLRLFDLLYPETVPGLAEQLHARTATQPPATAAPGRVSFVAAPPPLDYSTAVRLSTPHWDAHGQGVVVSVSGAVPCGVGDAACGVVGVDVSLSVLLHDILHHYTPLAGITSVVLHRSGEVLYHPVYGDAGSWGSPVTHDAGSWDSPVTRDAGSWGTPVTRTALQELEPVITDALQRRIVAQPTGHQTGPPDHTGGATHVWWRRLDRTAKDWILVVIRRPERRQRLLPLPSRDDGGGLLQASRDDGGDVLQASRDDGGDVLQASQDDGGDALPESLPPHAIYHRLDLLPPERALVCRQFSQMATFDAPTLYVSPRALTVSGRAALLSAQALRKSEERRIARIMRYLVALDGGINALLDANASHETLLEHNARLSFYSDAYPLEEEEETYAETAETLSSFDFVKTVEFDNEGFGGAKKKLQNKFESDNRGLDTWLKLEEHAESYAEFPDDKVGQMDADKEGEAGVEKPGGFSVSGKTSRKKSESENPGLNPWLKNELAALYSVAEEWQHDSDQDNETQPFIIRRLGVLSSGGLVEYPGFLSSPALQSRRFDWWLGRALTPPLTSRLLLPPRLDDAGAGYIVTVAAAVVHGESEAVLAADLTLGYWQRLLLELHPLCDTTGALLVTSGLGVRCFLADEEGRLVLHPALLRPPASTIDPPAHITVQEPLLSMALLDAAPSGGAPVLQKLSCARPWRGRRERRYRLTLPPGAPVASHSSHQPPGKWCVWYSLAAVPGTKLIFGVVNQTCDTATAFCPCSLVDRLCLNCQFVEAKACECPCECPTTSPFQCSSNSSSSRGNWRNPTQPEMLCPLDPPMPSLSHPQHVGLLGELQSCQTGTCGDHTTRHTCLGRPGCEWCSLTSPTNASENVWVSLEEPSCVPHPECPGGVKGGVSPYPRGLVPQPRHRESYRTGGGRSLPLAPVLGVMVGLVMVAGVGAAYCFHQHQGVMGAVTLTSRPGAPEGYTPAGLLSAGHVTTALEEELILDCQLGAAAMSPYRMNPAYRRPPAPGGDPSDPGYSTMTPHDDVPQRSSSSSSCLAIGVQSPSKNGKPSRDGRALLAKKRRPSRGLSSQPEEDCDENSSSPSGVFKGLASSSLLSGDHEPPTLDWSPEQLLQYFDDFDTGQCRHCNAPVSDGVCCNCEQTPCEECRSRPACQECHDSASCSRCRDQSSCPCKSKKRRRSRRRAGGGSVSDGIESDVASDGGCFSNAVLTSPQKIGPNQVIVPVTVHMVDSL